LCGGTAHFQNTKEPALKINAVEFDELLSKLTYESLAPLRDAVPTALHDQIEAAQTQALSTVEAVAEQTGQTMGYLPTRDVDEWLRLGLLDTFVAWVQGDATTCRHAPALTSPQPVWSCAWHPRLVVCGWCLPLLSAADEIADATCERCGYVTTGVDAGDPIYTLTVVAGVLTYQAGTCTDCLPRWHQHARTYLRPKVNRDKRRKKRRRP
jgi:hypothetical protein